MQLIALYSTETPPPKDLEQALKEGNVYSKKQYEQLKQQRDLTGYTTVEL